MFTFLCPSVGPNGHSGYEFTGEEAISYPGMGILPEESVQNNPSQANLRPGSVINDRCPVRGWNSLRCQNVGWDRA